jgi:hypothetical protein
VVQGIGAGRLQDDFPKPVVHGGYIVAAGQDGKRSLPVFPQLQTGGSRGKTLVFTHRQFTANPWPLLVNQTEHGVSVKRRTPAIIQPHHAHPAPLIHLAITIGYSGIGDQ